jgi:hypothetical protein
VTWPSKMMIIESDDHSLVGQEQLKQVKAMYP